MIDEAGGWHPLDGTPAPVMIPERWTPEWVATRLIDAYYQTGGSRWGLPPQEGQQSGIWPSYQHTWEDMLGWEAGDFRGRVWDQWGKQKPRISAGQWRLVDQAVCWPCTYLSRRKRRYAKALQIWLVSKTTNSRLNYMIGRSRISMATHKRDRRKALEMIAEGLRRDGIPVE